MRRRWITALLFTTAVLLLPKGDVEACGPFFEAEVFTRATSADDRAGFASGKLGIISNDDSSDMAVAFRYLNGGKLSELERAAYAPPSRQQPESPGDAAPARPKPNETWLSLRATYGPFEDHVAQELTMLGDPQGNIVLDSGYLTCPRSTFESATHTLTQRAEKWGNGSKWLMDWIHGQDAVLANCTGNSEIPHPAPADAPELLKADRAYQTAAAAFYGRKFDEATQQFAAIAADHNSPWSEWGTYLEARTLVRKAFDNGKTTDMYSGDLASFDPDTMRRAQQLLESLLAQPNPTPSRQIIQSELNFVLMRSDPEKRATELSAAMAGPTPDANFAQDLADLNFLLVKHIDLKGSIPLLDWIKAWRGFIKPADVYASWQQMHALPWLVAALATARAQDPFTPSLIEDAKKIDSRSPAHDTVFYHRVRLLIALKRSDEARSLLDAAIPSLRKVKPSSKLNALLGERLQVVRNFSEFLEFAPRIPLDVGSQGYFDLTSQCNERAQAVNVSASCAEAKSPEFDEDAARTLNTKIPVSLLIEAATTQSLPQNLREAIAIMAWTRSVMLGDGPSAAKLSQLLPKSIRDTAGASADFPAALAILRNPGVRPYIEAGVPRVSSYSTMDVYRNNWWCSDWRKQQGYGDSASIAVPDPGFITADQIALTDKQLAELQEFPDSAIVIGQRVLSYAKANPDDPLVPEALALTVRATHYACQRYDNSSNNGTGTEYTPTSKAAFELLHKRYPKSSWTAKTRYYY